jgi:DNA-binding Lrp family transcriptional regulator
VSAEVPSDQTVDEPWIVTRPSTLLMELPVNSRWEVTRRHPYYLRFWYLAHQYHQQPATDPQQQSWEESAVLVLQAIGVSGDPPPPGASSESLGANSLSKGWESGAVAPITFRGLADMLLFGLPPEARLELGQLLTASAESTEDPSYQNYQFLLELKKLRHSAFDAFPNKPVVGINVHAPQRVVVQAIEHLLRQWKEKSEIPERRRRNYKPDDYLAVWDLREGWTMDHYDSAREQTFLQIAQQLGVPISTVANRYRSAFRLIVGRDYTAELWARVLGFLKVAELVDPEELPKQTLRRPWRSRQPRRPVPESVLQPSHSDGESDRILNVAGVCQDEIAYRNLILDIKALLEQGESNDAIRQKLELSSSFSDDAFHILRTRHQDDLL